MPYVLIRHKVDDYAAWKPVFDDDGTTRAAHGSRSGHVFRNAEDPSEVVVLFEVDDLNRFRAHTSSDRLRTVMQEAGVSDQPDIYFLHEDDRVEA